MRQHRTLTEQRLRAELGVTSDVTSSRRHRSLHRRPSSARPGVVEGPAHRSPTARCGARRTCVARATWRSTSRQPPPPASRPSIVSRAREALWQKQDTRASAGKPPRRVTARHGRSRSREAASSALSRGTMEVGQTRARPRHTSSCLVLRENPTQVVPIEGCGIDLRSGDRREPRRQIQGQDRAPGAHCLTNSTGLSVVSQLAKTQPLGASADSRNSARNPP